MTNARLNRVLRGRLESETSGKGRTVTFLQPGSGAYPVGGFKVTYEYANGLADRGWHVRIIHPHMLSHEEIEKTRSSPLLRARRWIGYERRRLTGNYRPDRWFKVRPNVELLCTKTLKLCSLPASDVWVSTYWYTARWAATYPGTHLYLIQHLETWCGPEADVLATWKLPFRKVVISRWLEEVAHSLNESAEYIPNGLDFEAFGIDVAPETREPCSVAMLYHVTDWKGSSDGLSALRAVHKRYPALKAHIFGVYPRPDSLPAWAEYHQNPHQSKLREIYNQAAIFISPSWAEGWPLPPAEAMQCGAALTATDIGGHREYAHHEKTALLSTAKDPDGLAGNILRLVEDRELRLRLAHHGNQYVRQFTWDRAVTSFEAVMKDELAGRRKNESTSTADSRLVGTP